MGRIALALLAAFAAFGAFYLLGAFTAADFNIAQWSGMQRFMIGIFGFAGSVVIGIIIWAENS